jgi:HEAT repeat protein
MRPLGTLLRLRLFGPVAVLALSSCGERHAESYVAGLSDNDRQIRLEASISLIKLGGAAVQPVIEHATVGSDSLRYISAQILGQIGDRRAAPFLESLLEEPNAYVRAQGVRALGQLADPGQIPNLQQALVDDPVAEVRAEAAWSLGNLRNTTAVTALIEAMQDSSQLVRKGVLSALQYLWTPAAETTVIAALGDGSETVRYVAAQLLGFHRSAPALDPLCRALGDSSLWVRVESARALGAIGDTAVVARLERLFADREGPDHDAAAEALRQLTGLEYAISP